MRVDPVECRNVNSERMVWSPWKFEWYACQNRFYWLWKW